MQEDNKIKQDRTSDWYEKARTVMRAFNERYPTLKVDDMEMFDTLNRSHRLETTAIAYTIAPDECQIATSKMFVDLHSVITKHRKPHKYEVGQKVMVSEDGIAFSHYWHERTIVALTYRFGKPAYTFQAPVRYSSKLEIRAVTEGRGNIRSLEEHQVVRDRVEAKQNDERSRRLTQRQKSAKIRAKQVAEKAIRALIIHGFKITSVDGIEVVSTTRGPVFDKAFDTAVQAIVDATWQDQVGLSYY